MDLARALPLGAGMANDTDPEMLNLCRALCSQAGATLEDASACAVHIGGLSSTELLAVVQDVQASIDRAQALLVAAQALLERAGGDDG